MSGSPFWSSLSVSRMPPRKPLSVARTPPDKPPSKRKPKLAGAALKAHKTKTCAAPPAEKGNLRSVKHGARTEQLVAPRRQQA